MADLKKTFSNGHTTNWPFNSYNITEIVKDTISRYKIDNLEERYIEVLLKKAELSMKENKN